MDSKVTRFQVCSEESPLNKDPVKKNSLRKCIPPMDSGVLTTFPLHSDGKQHGGVKRNVDSLHTTPLCGKATFQKNIFESKSSLTVQTKDAYFSPAGGSTSTSSLSPQSKAPGFSFSKTSSAPTQWATPACSRDVTYKRVCVGVGPGSSLIVPVHAENIEEELASLILQLSLPQKVASIPPSW